MDFEKLNTIIKTDLSDEDSQSSFYYLDEIVKLAYIIIENAPVIDINTFYTYVPLSTSVKIASDFFKSLNPKFSYMFENILRHETNIYDNKNDYSVKFQKVAPIKKEFEKLGSSGLCYHEVSFANLDGSVPISYTESIEDIFTIVHEMTHKFSSPKEQFYMLKHFLGEVTSISMEFLLKDYLIENTDYDKAEILINNRNRLMHSVYFNSVYVIFESILLKLYKENNNHVTQDNLEQYLNSLEKDSIIYQLLIYKKDEYLQQILDKNSLNFYTHQRYIIGTLLACDFHSKINDNPKKISELFSLIDILGNTKLEADKDLNILKKLDIPLIHNNQLIVTEYDLTRLRNDYKNEIADVLYLKKDYPYKIVKDKKTLLAYYKHLQNLLKKDNQDDSVKYDIAGRKMK